MVETTGIEPATSAVQGRRNTIIQQKTPLFAGFYSTKQQTNRKEGCTLWVYAIPR